MPKRSIDDEIARCLALSDGDYKVELIKLIQTDPAIGEAVIDAREIRIRSEEAERVTAEKDAEAERTAAEKQAEIQKLTDLLEIEEAKENFLRGTPAVRYNYLIALAKISHHAGITWPQPDDLIVKGAWEKVKVNAIVTDAVEHIDENRYMHPAFMEMLSTVVEHMEIKLSIKNRPTSLRGPYVGPDFILGVLGIASFFWPDAASKKF